jgi:hypothetical protein
LKTAGYEFPEGDLQIAAETGKTRRRYRGLPPFSLRSLQIGLFKVPAWFVARGRLLGGRLCANSQQP